ncbi:cupin domain-containing protein [Halocatena halophila]|uniref:cupin domain-containing protein n=1 Tax=Halocatena halophila TaxID=2814576 RepID=UPI002ECFDE61
MDKINIEDARVVLSPLDVHSERRPISYELGTTDFVMNFFRLEPGESIAGLFHKHDDQEEVFYVEKGIATFTVGEDKKTVKVKEGELIRFPPGEFQRGDNKDDEPLTVWAIGAPGAGHDPDEVSVLYPCNRCQEETIHEIDRSTIGETRVICNECSNDEIL